MTTATLEMTSSYSDPSLVQPKSDEDLLLAYRDSGNRSYFQKLVQRYERELYNYLRRYLGDPEMAEDVFQAAFLQVHLKCDTFEVGRRFRPWLYTIATNQAIDAQRKTKRHKMVSLDRAGSSGEQQETGSLVDLLVSSEPGPMSQMDDQERQRVMRDAVQDLPESLKTAIVLVYYQGLKYREAADILGIPVGTVKSRLHTAVQKLTEAWNEVYTPDDDDA
ncbi:MULTISPECIES: RNA polymerase sigma factor [Bremerella]|uniref:RNA polymerase sigma factor n=1 Tax=Bremerella TaxID=2714594 RepID=UPI0031EB362E